MRFGSKDRCHLCGIEKALPIDGHTIHVKPSHFEAGYWLGDGWMPIGVATTCPGHDLAQPNQRLPGCWLRYRRM